MESVELDRIPINLSTSSDEEVVMPVTTTRSDEAVHRHNDYKRQIGNAYHRWQTMLDFQFEKQWQYVNAVNGLVVSCWDDDYSQVRIRGVVSGTRRRWRTALTDARIMKQSETMSATFSVIDMQTEPTWTLPAFFVRGLLDVDRKNGQMCFCTLERPHEYLSPAPGGADSNMKLTVGIRLNSLDASTDITIVLLCDTEHCWIRTRFFFSYYTALQQMLNYIVHIQDIVSSDDKWHALFPRVK
jgi:hypothetical protein